MPFNGQVQLIHSDIQTVHLCTEKIFIKQTSIVNNSTRAKYRIAVLKKSKNSAKSFINISVEYDGHRQSNVANLIGYRFENYWTLIANQ